MSHDPSASADFEALLDEIREDSRLGRLVSLEEYAKKHPELAAQLGTLLPVRQAPQAASDTTVAASVNAGAVPKKSSSSSGSYARVPERLDDFVIVREIGRGGMGVVYEALQESLKRRVALKVLPHQFTDNPALIHRFEREAQAAGRLHHTNIIPVFGVGQTDDQHYYVMQYIEGLPLSEVIAELRRQGESAERKTEPPARAVAPAPAHGLSAATMIHTLWAGAPDKPAAAPDEPDPFAATIATPAQPAAGRSVARRARRRLAPRLVSATALAAEGDSPKAWNRFARSVARLGEQAAEALAHAHQQGVLHRDIKPSNLLLDTQGVLWVADFGLAKLDDSEDLTMTGDIVGTLRYVAPERFKGRCDARSDIYALGLTLYEILALQPAYTAADRASLVRQISNDDPPRLSALSPSLPRDLVTIVHKAIDREPGARYQTAAALAEDLGRFLANRPILARRMTPGERFTRWCQRNPTIARLSAVLAALLLLGAVAATVTVVILFDLVTQRTKALNDQAVARAKVESTLADMYAFAGLGAGRAENFQQAALWSANSLSKGIVDPERARADAIRYQVWSQRVPKPTHALALRQPGLRQSNALPTARLAFDPTGRYVLAVGLPRGVLVWDLDHDALLGLPDEAASAQRACWNADGSLLAVADANLARVYRFPEIELVRQLELEPGEAIETLEFSPTDDRLAVGHGAQVTLWNAAGDGRRTELTHPERLGFVVWGRSGRRLATASASGAVRVFDVAPDLASSACLLGPIASACRSVGDSAGPPAFVDGDRLVLIPTSQRAFAWWDLASGDCTRTSKTDRSLVAIVVGPDGRRFTTIEYGDARQWSVATGSPIGQVIHHENYLYGVVYRPDGNALLTFAADRTAGLWDTETGTALTSAVLHQADATVAAYAPQGNRFVTAQTDGLLRVWWFDRSRLDPISIPIEAGEAFAALSAEKRLLAPAGWNHHRGMRSTRVYDTSTGQPEGPPLAVGGLVNAAAFSPVETLLATAASPPDHVDTNDWRSRLGEHPGEVQIWNWRTGERVAPAVPTPSEPVGVDFHPDGSALAVFCAGGQVLLIDAHTGAIKHTGDQQGRARFGFLVRGWIRFAPNGSTFATWGTFRSLTEREYPVCFWDGTTGELKHPLVLDDLCHQLLFSADSQTAFTACSNGRLESWRVDSGASAAPVSRQTDWVFNACLSPDGKSIVTAGRDKYAYLWDWHTGTPRCDPMRHPYEVFGVAFSRDGRWIFTSTKGKRRDYAPIEDATVEAWDSLSGDSLGWLGRFPSEVYQVDVNAEGTHLIVAGTTGQIALIPLAIFRSTYGKTAAETQAEAELLSGQTIRENPSAAGGVHNLTTDDWVQRWQNHTGKSVIRYRSGAGAERRARP